MCWGGRTAFSGIDGVPLFFPCRENGRIARGSDDGRRDANDELLVTTAPPVAGSFSDADVVSNCPSGVQKAPRCT